MIAANCVDMRTAEQKLLFSSVVSEQGSISRRRRAPSYASPPAQLLRVSTFGTASQLAAIKRSKIRPVTGREEEVLTLA